MVDLFCREERRHRDEQLVRIPGREIRDDPFGAVVCVQRDAVATLPLQHAAKLGDSRQEFGIRQAARLVGNRDCIGAEVGKVLD